MEVKKAMDLLGVIKKMKAFLTFVGFYSLANDQYETLQDVTAAFFLSIGYLYLAVGTKFAIQNVSNLDWLSETIDFLLTVAAVSVKLVCLFCHKKNLQWMGDMLQRPLITEVDVEEENMMNHNLRLSRVVKILCVIETAINTFCSCMYIMLSKKISIKMWFPFNIEKHFFVAGCYVIPLSIVDLCASRFILLKGRLTKIESVLTGEEVMDNKRRVELLKKCIVDNVYSYGVYGLIKEPFLTGMFSQIACSSVAISFSLFKVFVVPPKSIHFVVLLAHACDMLVQLCIYCFSLLGLQSDTITETCYMSKWYDCSLEVQRYLAIIMERAHEPLTLRLGGMVSLNMKTLQCILSTTYSFFTLFWQMYTES